MVSYLQKSTRLSPDFLAAGFTFYHMKFNIKFFSYEDGDIIIWDLESNEAKCNLDGHKSGVSFLNFIKDVSTKFT